MVPGIPLECRLGGLCRHRRGPRPNVTPGANADKDIRVGNHVAIPLRTLPEAGHDHILVRRGAVDNLEDGIPSDPAVTADVSKQQHALTEYDTQPQPVQADGRPDDPAHGQHAAQEGGCG